MKTLKIFIAFLALSTSVAHAQFTKAELQVSGLTCSMCSKATEKSLRTLGFISDIKVDLNRNLFLISFKKDAQVNFDQISKKVQSAGFFVNNLKATFNFANTKIDDNWFSYAGDNYRVVAPTNKELTGPAAITIVDKGFAPAAVYKKYNTSVADNSKPGRVYHVVI